MPEAVRQQRRTTGLDRAAANAPLTNEVRARKLAADLFATFNFLDPRGAARLVNGEYLKERGEPQTDYDDTDFEEVIKAKYALELEVKEKKERELKGKIKDLEGAYEKIRADHWYFHEQSANARQKLDAAKKELSTVEGELKAIKRSQDRELRNYENQLPAIEILQQSLARLEDGRTVSEDGKWSITAVDQDNMGIPGNPRGVIVSEKNGSSYFFGVNPNDRGSSGVPVAGSSDKLCVYKLDPTKFLDSSKASLFDLSYSEVGELKDKRKGSDKSEFRDAFIANFGSAASPKTSFVSSTQNLVARDAENLERTTISSKLHAYVSAAGGLFNEFATPYLAKLDKDSKSSIYSAKIKSGSELEEAMKANGSHQLFAAKHLFLEGAKDKETGVYDLSKVTDAQIKLALLNAVAIDAKHKRGGAFCEKLEYQNGKKQIIFSRGDGTYVTVNPSGEVETGSISKANGKLVPDQGRYFSRADALTAIADSIENNNFFHPDHNKNSGTYDVRSKTALLAIAGIGDVVSIPLEKGQDNKLYYQDNVGKYSEYKGKDYFAGENNSLFANVPVTEKRFVLNQGKYQPAKDFISGERLFEIDGKFFPCNDEDIFYGEAPNTCAIARESAKKEVLTAQQYVAQGAKHDGNRWTKGITGEAIGPESSKQSGRITDKQRTQQKTGEIDKKIKSLQEKKHGSFFADFLGLFTDRWSDRNKEIEAEIKKLQEQKKVLSEKPAGVKVNTGLINKRSRGEVPQQSPQQPTHEGNPPPPTLPRGQTLGTGLPDRTGEGRAAAMGRRGLPPVATTANPGPQNGQPRGSQRSAGVRFHDFEEVTSSSDGDESSLPRHIVRGGNEAETLRRQNERLVSERAELKQMYSDLLSRFTALKSQLSALQLTVQQDSGNPLRSLSRRGGPSEPYSDPDSPRPQSNEAPFATAPRQDQGPTGSDRSLSPVSFSDVPRAADSTGRSRDPSPVASSQLYTQAQAVPADVGDQGSRVSTNGSRNAQNSGGAQVEALTNRNSPPLPVSGPGGSGQNRRNSDLSQGNSMADAAIIRPTNEFRTSATRHAASTGRGSSPKAATAHNGVGTPRDRTHVDPRATASTSRSAASEEAYLARMRLVRLGRQEQEHQNTIEGNLGQPFVPVGETSQRGDGRNPVGTAAALSTLRDQGLVNLSGGVRGVTSPHGPSSDDRIPLLSRNQGGTPASSSTGRGGRNVPFR